MTGLGEPGRRWGRVAPAPCLTAQPVQFAVAACLVLPVDGLLDHLGAGQGSRCCHLGEVLEVLGHSR